MGTALLSLQQTSTDSRLARSIWFRGALITVHADSEDTNGKFALFEVSGCPGGEPPLHIHENEDEMFYVLEGRMHAFHRRRRNDARSWRLGVSATPRAAYL